MFWITHILFLAFGYIPVQDIHLPPIQEVDIIEHNSVWHTVYVATPDPLQPKWHYEHALDQTIAWKYYYDDPIPHVVWWTRDHIPVYTRSDGTYYVTVDASIIVAKQFRKTNSIDIDPEMHDRDFLPVLEREGLHPWRRLQNLLKQEEEQERTSQEGGSFEQ